MVNQVYRKRQWREKILHLRLALRGVGGKPFLVKLVEGTLQVPQGTHFISDPTFQNMGPNVVQEKGADTLDHCYFPLFKKNLYFIKKIQSQADKIKTSWYTLCFPIFLSPPLPSILQFCVFLKLNFTTTFSHIPSTWFYI